MSSKFFTNTSTNTLFDKFRGIANGMANFHSFHAVVGFFRSSGYFKLREELVDVSKIQILVGINIDNIFKKHNRAMLMFGSDEEAKSIYNQDFIQDVETAGYSYEVEKGILQLCEDLQSGKVEMKIHTTKNLHAKFYLCLPENHSQHSDGWVIMGSSNISESGLGLTDPPRYELNVAMKDYDDVDFCKKEFDELWKHAVPLTLNDIEKAKKKTHIGSDPTPYELYIKVLIDSFGNQVEDDFSITLPDGFTDLKYQKDAEIQGYQMLKDHNGFFLADVVGLGKTVVAARIAKRFVEANGKDTNILIVYPPALENNWRDTFRQFGLTKKTQFVSNGSLSYILDSKHNYKDKEEFDLIIVDEAHNFRSDSTYRYDDLQRICKSRRQNIGLVEGKDKKVMLLSATPLNNRPEDLLNLILLFQDKHCASINGVTNLLTFFAPLIARYKEAMKQRKTTKNTEEIEKIYEPIRTRILDKITVRRTRNNIWNDDDYKQDLIEQKIKFPDILPPNDLTYQLEKGLDELFYNTLKSLTEEIHYARYRAVEFIAAGKYKGKANPKNIGANLAGIYRVHMVKRLESSFYAFKKSLDTFIRITKDMIGMFEQNKIIVAPELNVKELQAKGMELDTIIEYAVNKGYEKSDILFSTEDFIEKDGKKLIDLLNEDLLKLQILKSEWDKVKNDPKLDLFIQKLKTELFNTDKNPTGKLVIFSESVDTVNYLEENLKEQLQRKDIIKVSSENRKRDFEIVKNNFDANIEKEKQKSDYNIVISSEVLAEGVNLHRANVVVNYDSPWNATRLMQRIGRVNRIGSVAGKIYNYMFYPSQQGNEQIRLYENALIKLQGFHSALGEDAQIYSREEIVKEFQLYNPKIKDRQDKQLELLREVRELYNTDRELYKKIKDLPIKSRTTRNANTRAKSKTTIAFIQSPLKTEYYKIMNNNEVISIDFLDAAEILKAEKTETSADFSKISETHFLQVNSALKKFENESIVQQDSDSISVMQTNDKKVLEAQKFLRKYVSTTQDSDVKKYCNTLVNLINRGTYSHLPKELINISRKYSTILNEKQYEIDKLISGLYHNYNNDSDFSFDIDNTAPTIVLSETFI